MEALERKTVIWAREKPFINLVTKTVSRGGMEEQITEHVEIHSGQPVDLTEAQRIAFADMIRSDGAFSTDVPIGTAKDSARESPERQIQFGDFTLRAKGAGWFDVMGPDGLAQNETGMKYDDAAEYAEDLATRG